MLIDAHTCWNTYEMKGIRLPQEEYIAALDRSGIDMAMVCTPFYLQSDFILGNDRILQLMKRYPSRIIGFATLQPLFEKEMLLEMERCANAGMRGIKLHCDLSQVPYDDPLTFPLVEKAVDLGLPLFLHTGKSSIMAAVSLAEKYPEATFIFAHIGDVAWRQMCLLARNLKNVTLCLSGQVFERGFLEKAVSSVGDGRVVYGSDFVFLNPAINLGIIRGSGLSEESKAKILGTNMQRMLAL